MPYRNNIMLALGLITFPVAISGATAKDETLTTVCVGKDDTTPHDPTPIKQHPACPACENDNYPSFKKARKSGKQYAVVSPDEIAALKDESIGDTKTTIALTPHPAGEVHTQTLQDGSVYYLTPATPAAAKGYALLVDTLRENPEVALTGFWTPVSRPGLYEIKLFGDTLVMEQRANPEAVKVMQVPAETPDPVMKTQMGMLLPMMMQPFDPATYANTYRARLNELIASQDLVEGAAPDKDGKATPGAVADVSAQLTAMLASYSAPKAPAKKAAAKKTAAKKATAA